MQSPAPGLTVLGSPKLPLEIQFCGLARIDVAIQATTSVGATRILEEARSRSGLEHQPVVTRLGDPPLRARISPHGAKGGYRYKCSAQAGRESWLLKQHDSKD